MSEYETGSACGSSVSETAEPRSFGESEGFRPSESSDYSPENRETGTPDTTETAGYGSEVPSVESSQELAETAHDSTKQDMLSEHGECMSPEQVSRLSSDETKTCLNVMSAQEYTETFTDVDVNVLGHCDESGNIYVKDISPEIVDHVSTHETMHLCANRENLLREDGTRTVVSGLREKEYSGNRLVSDFGRGVNEGTTEMYTMRELKNRGEETAAYAVHSYSEARMWSERMEKVVGEDKFAEAYFGGKRAELAAEFNRLNGNNPEAWSDYVRDINTLTYGDDPDRINAANARLTAQFRTMAHNKFGI